MLSCFLWWALEDCLESLALNVSTDFASKNFVLFAKVLRTLLTPRSNSGKASPCGVLIVEKLAIP